MAFICPHMFPKGRLAISLSLRNILHLLIPHAFKHTLPVPKIVSENGIQIPLKMPPKHPSLNHSQIQPVLRRAGHPGPAARDGREIPQVEAIRSERDDVLALAAERSLPGRRSEGQEGRRRVQRVLRRRRGKESVGIGGFREGGI